MRATAFLLTMLLLLAFPAFAQNESVGEVVQRGLSRYDNGDYEGARSEAARALELEPESFDALLLMGRVLGRSGQVAEAIPYLDRALALKPQDPVALRAKSTALFDSGDVAAARKLLDEALALYPDDSSLYFNRAAFMYSGKDSLTPDQLTAVTADLRRAAELNPKDSQTWATTAWVIWNFQDDPAKALPYMDKAIKLKERAIDYSLRAELHRRLGNLKKARTDLDRALQLGGSEELMKSIRSQIQGLHVDEVET